MVACCTHACPIITLPPQTVLCLPRSTYLLVDPCEREERVMDGLLMIAMNKHREICSIQSSGGIMLLKEQVNATGDPGS